MKYLLPLAEVRPRHRRLVGGKGYALAVLAQHGIPIPATVVITTRAYEDFVRATGLRGRILLELRRKRFEDLRWEEIWDLALRIRHLFLTAPYPGELEDQLRRELSPHLPAQAVLRSSAPGEDSRRASFAGLHASYVNVVGLASVLDHIKLVWASLWSDAALLYRRELGLQVGKSTMAVLLQELIPGEKSGVAFSQHPQYPGLAVIEAVYGLNQGLVDGSVEPDRWLVDREGGRIVDQQAAGRRESLQPAAEGVQLAAGPQAPPLTPAEVGEIYLLLRQLEEIFGGPQDLEWTIAAGRLVVLQCRPITTSATAPADDQRPWYLSLRRSFTNLQHLRQRVEQELLPALDAEAAALAAQPLADLSLEQLREALLQRCQRYRHWKKIYWDEFIPLAHGVRLFGQLYNDTVKPRDPFEFLSLLGQADLLSLRRNRLLLALAESVRARPELLQELRRGTITDSRWQQQWSAFWQEFGPFFCGFGGCAEVPEALLDLLAKLAQAPATTAAAPSKSPQELTARFLDRFQGAKRTEMAAYLELARASYRLRDDDNLYLGKLQAQVLRAAAAYRQRGGQDKDLPPAVRELLQELAAPPKTSAAGGWSGFGTPKARQLVGQPAAPGLARGPARIILETSDLFRFQPGEILVCDAIDPSLTFVVPLAAAIVERRGGMLIHGSIIAREYGLPCVTGVPQATTAIHTGDRITVDGYLGLVIIG